MAAHEEGVIPFRQDQFRYLGALGGASLDLDFFGFDPDGPLADDPAGYTLEPRFVVPPPETIHRSRW